LYLAVESNAGLSALGRDRQVVGVHRVGEHFCFAPKASELLLGCPPARSVDQPGDAPQVPDRDPEICESEQNRRRIYSIATEQTVSAGSLMLPSCRQYPNARPVAQATKPK